MLWRNGREVEQFVHCGERQICRHKSREDQTDKGGLSPPGPWDVGPVLLLRAMSPSVALLQLGSGLMSMAGVTPQTPNECTRSGPQPEAMSEGHAATRAILI